MLGRDWPLTRLNLNLKQLRGAPETVGGPRSPRCSLYKIKEFVTCWPTQPEVKKLHSQIVSVNLTSE